MITEKPDSEWDIAAFSFPFEETPVKNSGIGISSRSLSHHEVSSHPRSEGCCTMRMARAAESRQGCREDSTNSFPRALSISRA